MAHSSFRIGYGFDSHAFRKGVPLKIGGVAIEHPRGLAGHSDGDVLLHALTDALLGAVAAGDIGSYFPPDDPRWKGADSALFVREALKQVEHAGYTVANVDSTLILQEPKIGPHVAELQRRVAELLALAPGAVGIKAKTPEGLDTPNTAIAHVTVLLMRKAAGGKKQRKTAAEVPQPVVDLVVEHTLAASHAQEPRKTRHKVKAGSEIQRR